MTSIVEAVEKIIQDDSDVREKVARLVTLLNSTGVVYIDPAVAKSLKVAKLDDNGIEIFDGESKIVIRVVQHPYSRVRQIDIDVESTARCECVC